MKDINDVDPVLSLAERFAAAQIDGVVDIDSQLGRRIEQAPCLVLERLTEATLECLGQARSYQLAEGNVVIAVLHDERSLLVFNRWYGTKSLVRTADGGEETLHMFSAFRRAFVDQQDMNRRAPPDHLACSPYMGGVSNTTTLEACDGLVDTTTMDWLESLGEHVGIVQLYFDGSVASARSGVVALQLEPKRVGNRLEPLDDVAFEAFVGRVRQSSRDAGKQWKSAERCL